MVRERPHIRVDFLTLGKLIDKSAELLPSHTPVYVQRLTGFPPRKADALTC